MAKKTPPTQGEINISTHLKYRFALGRGRAGLPGSIPGRAAYLTAFKLGVWAETAEEWSPPSPVMLRSIAMASKLSYSSICRKTGISRATLNRTVERGDGHPRTIRFVEWVAFWKVCLAAIKVAR